MIPDDMVEEGVAGIRPEQQHAGDPQRVQPPEPARPNAAPARHATVHACRPRSRRSRHLGRGMRARRAQRPLRHPWRQDEEDPDLAHWPYDDNPYRNEHA